MVGFSFTLSAQQFIFGTGGDGNDVGLSVDVATDGSVYCAGTLDWPAIYDGVNLGNVSGFLARHSNIGNVIWSKGLYSMQPIHVESDDSNNVYVAGAFIGTLVFPGGDTIVSNSYWDIVVIKYDAGGTYLWASSWGSSSLNEIDRPNSIRVTGNGLFVCGENFGQCFAAKLNFQGTMKWMDQGVSNLRSRGYSIAIDSIGNYWTAGYVSSYLELNDDTLYSQGSKSAFICQYDPTGTLINPVILSHSTGFYQALNIKTLVAESNVLGTVSGLSGKSVILSRLDPGLNPIWTSKIRDTATEEYPYSLAIDKNRAYITGLWGRS